MLSVLVAALCLLPFVIAIVRGVRREDHSRRLRARDRRLYDAAVAARADDRRESRLR